MLIKLSERSDDACRMLLPLLDMINHANQPGANLHIMQAESGDIYAYTLRDIRAGEEVRGQHVSGCSGATKS